MSAPRLRVGMTLARIVAPGTCRVASPPWGRGGALPAQAASMAAQDKVRRNRMAGLQSIVIGGRQLCAAAGRRADRAGHQLAQSALFERLDAGLGRTAGR